MTTQEWLLLGFCAVLLMVNGLMVIMNYRKQR